MRPEFFDPEGAPIDEERWGNLVQLKSLADVGDTRVLGKYRVITIYTGINANPRGGIPLIYQTAIVKPNGTISTVRRYPDRGSARRGHSAIVQTIKKGGVDKVTRITGRP